MTTAPTTSPEEPSPLDDVEIFDTAKPIPPLNLPGEEVLESKVDEIIKDVEKLEVMQEKVEGEVQRVAEELVKMQASKEEDRIDEVAAITLITLAQEQEQKKQQQPQGEELEQTES